jgi:hypothetical protein
MNDSNEKKQIVTRIEELSRQRKKIFFLSSEKALETILDYPQPAALVHSFSEEDFYFLIHDIGIEDAYPLLTLASDRQWEYIVDLETWQKDRIELISITKWLDLLFRIDPDRFIHWFLDKKTEFVELYLYKNIEVRIRETDQEPSDFDDDFFTHDDTFYIRFVDDFFDFSSHESDSKKEIKAQRDAFLLKFLEVLSRIDHVSYQKVLLESSSVIPAETEEEEYRLRSVRLAEKGFMPYEEAIGIYQPLKARSFAAKQPKFSTKDPERKLFFPIPIYPNEMIEEENLFASALKRIDIDDMLEQIQIEFAGMCNRILCADQKIVREREELKRIVNKACGYISIGLEALIENSGVLKINQCAGLIQRYSLSSIFRVGYGYALDLKWRAERWRERSWFEQEGLLISFWGEEWTGVLGGLLLKKPMFYDNYVTGVLYREFISMEDVEKTERVLNEIIAFDDLFSKLKITPEPIASGFLTYKNFILTIWALHYLGIKRKRLTLSIKELKRFFDDLWKIDMPPRKIGRGMKEKFLSFLSDQTGRSREDISQQLAYGLENLFDELESEYGKVDGKELDPRYVHHFLVK